MAKVTKEFTLKRINLIKSVWKQDMSASQIASAIGSTAWEGDISRNAIIGFFNRHAEALKPCKLGVSMAEVNRKNWALRKAKLKTKDTHKKHIEEAKERAALMEQVEVKIDPLEGRRKELQLTLDKINLRQERMYVTDLNKMRGRITLPYVSILDDSKRKANDENIL